MLEDGSKDLPAASREQERQWNNYNANRVGEESSKRPLEGGEDSASKKAIKQIEGQEEKEEIAMVRINQPENHEPETRLALSLMQPEQQPNEQQHEGSGMNAVAIFNLNQPDSNVEQSEDGSDTNSLINQLGRELTISCLVFCKRADYGTIASLNKSFKSLVKSGLLYKIRRGMGIAEHWVYFSCNLLEWEVFDPIRCGWTQLPRMISNECFMCSDKESLAVGTELLVFGKEIQSHVIYQYSILTNVWTSGMKMNTPRCLFGSASLGAIAIIAGGCDPTGKILDAAELYDSETGTWTTIPSMNTARKMCSGVFMDGKFYVIGGIGAQNANVIKSGEVYDLETKTWTEIPNMCPPRKPNNWANGSFAGAEAPPLVAVASNELYAADYAEREVLKYDKKTNTWTILGGLPNGAASMNGWGLAFRACGDRLVVIGGPRTYGGGVIELNSWVPNDGPLQWKLLARKPSGSFVYNCAIMGC